jgi:AcrR family transcriptional regulator
VYGHFGDLGRLLEALVERERTRAQEQLARVVPEELGERDARAALLAALRGYLQTVQADPDTWRLVLMPPEGAPASLREAIASGRRDVVAQLAAALGPGVTGSPDPELTARTLSAVADEAARLLLTEPERYSLERIVAHARWLLGQLELGPPVGERPSL